MARPHNLRGGRPPKGDLAATHMVCLRFTAEQLERLEAVVARSGTRRATYCVQVVMAEVDAGPER